MSFIKTIFMIFLLTAVPGRAAMVDGWNIQIGSVDITSKLSLEQEVETYTGDMMLHHIEQTPAPGHLYVIVPVTATRIDRQAGLFNASDIRLKAGKKIIDRVADDSFLIDYNILPFTRLKIKLGTHKGSVIFEVPESDARYPLTLLYKNIPLEEK